MWSKDETRVLSELYDSGKSIKELSEILNKTEISVYKKLKRIEKFNGRNKFWSDDELLKLKQLSGLKMTIKQISDELGRTIFSIRRKAFRNNIDIVEETRKVEIDWEVIQSEYDSGLNYKQLLKKFKLTPKKIIKAQKSGQLKFRNRKDAWKKSVETGNRKIKEKNNKLYKDYRELCSFNFNLSDFSDEFDFGLIEKFGWYKAKNCGDNPGGVSRDHMISIKYGFENQIDPMIISHPANCKLILQVENSKKREKNSLTLSELLNRIKNWNLKYGQVGEC
ncbi:hypothetical protein EBU91_04835 [bacterium]|nr:hypothetical protein [bacterium]